MKNVVKLSRKAILLAVMTVGLFMVGFGNYETSANNSRPCCSECEANYQICIDNGGTPAQCQQENSFCFRWCLLGC